LPWFALFLYSALAEESMYALAAAMLPSTAMITSYRRNLSASQSRNATNTAASRQKTVLAVN
jgi:hypothetical protein